MTSQELARKLSAGADAVAASRREVENAISSVFANY